VSYTERRRSIRRGGEWDFISLAGIYVVREAPKEEAGRKESPLIRYTWKGGGERGELGARDIQLLRRHAEEKRAKTKMTRPSRFSPLKQSIRQTSILAIISPLQGFPTSCMQACLEALWLPRAVHTAASRSHLPSPPPPFASRRVHSSLERERANDFQKRGG